MVHLQIKEMDNNPVCDALIEGVRVPQEEGMVIKIVNVFSLFAYF